VVTASITGAPSFSSIPLRRSSVGRSDVATRILYPPCFAAGS
jgi:hypothetical protein